MGIQRITTDPAETSWSLPTLNWSPNPSQLEPYPADQTYTNVNDMSKIPRLSKYQWAGLNNPTPEHPEEKARAGEYSNLYGNDVYYKDHDFFKPLYENLAWQMGWDPETMNQGVPTTFSTRGETPEEEKSSMVTVGSVVPDYRLPVTVSKSLGQTGVDQYNAPALHKLEMLDDNFWNSYYPGKTNTERAKQKTFNHEYGGHILSSRFANTKQDDQGNVFIANRGQNWDSSTAGFNRYKGAFSFIPMLRQPGVAGKQAAIRKQIMDNPRMEQEPFWKSAIADAAAVGLTDDKWFGSRTGKLFKTPAYLGNPEEITARQKAEFLRLKGIERVHRFSQDSKPQITPQTYNAYENMFSMAPLQSMY